MGQAIAVRTDFTAGEVRQFAKRARDAAQARRLLAIAAVLDGVSREDAAKIGGMDRQTLRDWVIRFNEQGPDGLINIPSPGVPPKLGKKHSSFLVRLVEEGPIPAVHGVVRWRACDLIMRLHEEFGLSVSDDTIYRALRDLGFSHLSARPKAYKQDPDAMEAFKKNFAVRMAEVRAKLAPGTPVEVWFQDEMRVGQKNKLTYRWARKGSRPRAAHDQRTQSTYLFGAVCPEHGTGAALVLPFYNTEAMQLHLDEIATRVTAGAHAILILDQAGWHGAKELKIPTTYRSYNCRRVHLSSTAKKISGNSSDKTGCRTGSSNPSTTSSITVAMPGTPSSISPGKSCPSHVATGPSSVTHSEDWYNSNIREGFWPFPKQNNSLLRKERSTYFGTPSGHPIAKQHEKAASNRLNAD